MKKFLALLLSLIMLFTACVSTVGVATAEAGDVYIGFTSDVHDGTGNLENWFKNLPVKLSNMAYCGDYSYQYGSSYLNVFKTVVDLTDQYVGSRKGIYTSGNHEYMNYINQGGKLSDFSDYTSEFIRLGGASNNASAYYVYCMGAYQGDGIGGFQKSDITSLSNYLSSHTDKPVFILSHYPLHYISSRTISNAKSVIDELNKYPNAVFVWGHNHSQSAESHYGEILTYGESIQYTSSSSAKINFNYVCAGALTNNSGKQGNYKGVVAKVNGTKVTFTYYNTNGSVVNLKNHNSASSLTADFSTASGHEDDPEKPTTLTFVQTNKFEIGKKYLIVNKNANGSAKALSNNSGRNGSTVDVTIVDGKITLSSDSKAVWEAIATGTGSNLIGLKNGSNVLKINAQTTSSPYINTADTSYNAGGFGYTANNHISYPYGQNPQDYFIGSNGDSFTAKGSESGLGAVYIFAVGEGSDEPVVPSGKTVEVTPSSSNSPTANLTLAVNEEAKIKIKNGSSSQSYTFTVNATSGSDVVSVSPSPASIQIAAGATGEVTVKGLKNGSATLSITNNSQYGARKATINITVTGGSEQPVTPSGKTVEVTPSSSSSPTEALALTVNEEGKIRIKNGSSSQSYTFTVNATSGSDVVSVSPASIQIAAGATGEVTVKGLKNGTATLSITNNNSSYARKATINVTVTGGSEEPVTPSGKTVEVTPTTDNPTGAISISVGENGTVKVTNGGSSNYTFTMSAETNDGIVSFTPNSLSLAQNATGEFTVTGLKAGTAVLTIANTNQYGSQYVRKATVTVTVTGGSEQPVTPTGDTKSFTYASSVKAGTTYLLVSNGYALTNGSGTSVSATKVTVSNNTITLDTKSANYANLLWTAGTSSSYTSQGSITFKNGSDYFARANSSNNATTKTSLDAYTVWTYDGSDLSQKNSSGQYTFYATYQSNAFTANVQQANSAELKLYALNGSVEPEQPTLEVDKNALTIKKGSTGTFGITVTGGTATVASNNNGVATAALSGNTVTVTAVSAGTATITVSVGSISKTVTITVTEDEPIVPSGKTVEVTPSSSSSPTANLSLAVNEEAKIKITNGSSYSGYKFTVSATSGNGVVSVSPASIEIAAGATGEVTVKGLKNGTATLSITNDGSYSTRKATINVTVTGGSEEPVTPSGKTVEVTPTTDNPTGAISISVGENGTVKVTNGGSSEYTFTVSATSGSDVVSMSPSSVKLAKGATGEITVTGLKAGTAVLNIANSNSYGSQYVRKATITVTVTGGSVEPEQPTLTVDKDALTIKKGETGTFGITVTGGTATVASNNNGVATAALSGNTVTVTAVSAGTATITVSVGSISKTVTITVTEDEPVVPSGDLVFSQTNKFEIGKKYLIVNKNANGSAKALSNNSGRNGSTVDVTIVDGKITLDSKSSSDSKAIWEAIATGTGSNLIGLKNGSNVLKINAQTTSSPYINTADTSYNAGGFGYTANNHISYPYGQNPQDYFIGSNGDSFTAKGSESGLGAVYIFAMGEGSDEPVVPTGKTVEVTPTTDNPAGAISISVGENGTIKVKNEGRSTYTFTMSAASGSDVATFSPNSISLAQNATGEFTVTGKKAGTAVLNIANDNTYGSQYTRKATITVTVTGGSVEPEQPTLEVDKNALTIKKGETGTFGITFTGGTATVASNNNGVATAALSGNTVTVTAVSAGTATITVTVGSISKTVTITVTEDPTLTVDTNALAIKKGSTGTFGITFTGGTPSVTTNKADVATATVVGNTVTVTAVGTGTATITVTVGSISKTVTITVDDPVKSIAFTNESATVQLKGSIKLTATVTTQSGATLGNEVLTFTSSNPAIASVGEDGTVNGLSIGTAVITAAAEGVTAQCTVTVKCIEHHPVEAAYVAPTRTTYGRTAGSYCDLCGTVLEGMQQIPPLTDVPTLVLPSALIEIGEEAYSGTGVECVVIPNGCKTISSKAFADCAKLKLIEIPASVTTIAADAFANTPDVVIVTTRGSAADTFAADHGIPCMLTGR